MPHIQTERSPRQWHLRGIVLVVVLLGLLGLTTFDALLPVDRSLSNWRFQQSERAASQSIVFLDIDGSTLDDIGIWPWPRSIHAEVLNRLMEIGAYDVWVDIDFSARSSVEGDVALAEALQAAGGYVYLAAFQRLEGADTVLARPLPEFLEHADMFAVNALTDETGVVRAVPAYIGDEQWIIPSLATALAGNVDNRAYETVDYGIDSGSIPRISVRALLDGTANPDLIAGRHVVLGTSALELKDIFFTPNQGPLPGGVVQILAAETALAGRSLVSLSPWWVLGITAMLFCVQFALPIAGMVLRLCTLAMAAVVVEGIALALYLESAIMAPTSVYHVGTLALMVGTAMLDTRVLSVLVHKIGGERDALRAMLEQVIEDNYDGVLIARSNGMVLSASRFAANFLGVPPEGRNLANLLPAPIVSAALGLSPNQTSQNGEAVALTENGPRNVDFVVTRSTYGQYQQSIVTVTFRDITERKQSEARLQFLAEHDPVTNTLSRVGFLNALRASKMMATTPPGVFVLQLERFGIISASLGHEAGDLLLRQFAERLARRGFAAVAHLGQAQFAIAATDCDPPQHQFESISEIVRMPFDLDGHAAKVGLSAGYAPAAADCEPEAWLRYAEAALVSIEDRNLGRLAIYDGTQTRRVAQNRSLESQLARALDDNAFFLQFQPQIDLPTGRTIGAEALLRWRREGEIVPPSDFLPIAEETGMIVDITRWILVESCRAALDWGSSMRVAVNVSALHFELGDLVQDVATALELTGLPASRLELEITETATMTTRKHAIGVLAKLRSMGITIAIDDFGTGQSSLSYLDELPFDILKIDKAFIDRLDAPDAPHGIVKGIIGIAHTMNKRVLAEGVETAGQAELLRALGCEFGQGYYWSRPTDAALVCPRAARNRSMTLAEPLLA